MYQIMFQPSVKVALITKFLDHGVAISQTQDAAHLSVCLGQHNTWLLAEQLQRLMLQPMGNPLVQPD